EDPTGTALTVQEELTSLRSLMARLPRPRRPCMIPTRTPSLNRAPDMVERRTELNRRYHRKKKMGKLKAKLAAAKSGHERETILKKIHRLSPWWVEPKPQTA